MTIPPDVVLLFSYITGILSIVRFYWGGAYLCGGGALTYVWAGHLHSLSSMWVKTASKEDASGEERNLKIHIRLPGGEVTVEREPMSNDRFFGMCMVIAGLASLGFFLAMLAILT